MLLLIARVILAIRVVIAKISTCNYNNVLIINNVVLFKITTH